MPEVKVDFQKLVNFLNSTGFKQLGSILYGIREYLFWNPKLRIELQLVDLSEGWVVKAMKKYRLKAVSEEGRELYNRDLPALMDYLKSHLPEAHLYMAFMRDIVPDITPAGKQGRDIESRLGQVKRIFDEKRDDLNRRRKVKNLIGSDFELAGPYLERKVKDLQGDLKDLADQGKKLERELRETHELINRWTRKGVGTVLAFGYSSELQFLRQQMPPIEKAIEDVERVDKYQIKQKLEGGRYNIYVEELTYPWVAYSSAWTGIFSPRAVKKLGVQKLKEQVYPFFMVTAGEDIKLAKATKAKAKRLPAQAFRTFLDQVEKVPKRSQSYELPSSGIWIGNLLEGQQLADPYLLPLHKLNNLYISGSTGSGKSFLARVIVEGAVLEGVRTVILDPRNQWAGLLFPEDRKEILKRYEQFGISPSLAQGFQADYFSSSQLEDIPRLTGDQKPKIVSFKHQGARKRCRTAKQILDHLFQESLAKESQQVETLVVLEEAQLFTPRGVPDECKPAAKEVEKVIDRIGREARKYGLNILLVSQTIKDFAYSSATVRQNVVTKAFMRNSDRELDYASDFLPDASSLTELKSGEVFFYNPDLGGAIKIMVRPPFSQVKEPPPSQLAKVIDRQYAWRRFVESAGSIRDRPPKAGKHKRTKASLSEDELSFIQVVQSFDQGELPNVSQVLDRAEFTANRAKIYQVMEGLEEKGLIQTKKVGRSRRIELVG